MRKVILLAAIFLGTVTLVNAQTAPAAKTETTKVVKHAKKQAKKAEATATAAKVEAPKASAMPAKK
jgi:hypothetical protein